MTSKSPFESLFGNTAALRTLEFLIPLQDLRFNIKELAEHVGVSRQTMSRIIKVFLRFGLLKGAEHRSATIYYTLNRQSSYIRSLEQINNQLIEDLIDQDTLFEIGDHWRTVEEARDIAKSALDMTGDLPGEEPVG